MTGLPGDAKVLGPVLSVFPGLTCLTPPLLCFASLLLLVLMLLLLISMGALMMMLKLAVEDR